MRKFFAAVLAVCMSLTLVACSSSGSESSGSAASGSGAASSGGSENKEVVELKWGSVHPETQVVTQMMMKAIDEIKAAGEKRTIPQYDNSGKLMIELHEIMSDTLDYSLDCSAGTVQQDYIMLRPIVMTFRTSTYAQARQIVDRLCSSENISQISDMNMNTYTEGRNSGTVETTLVITYFEIMS